MRKLALLIFLFAGKAFAENCTYQIEADYLAWFIKKNPLPVPCVTRASLDDEIPGALGQPHTRILLGKEEIGMGWMQGFEVQGAWTHRNRGLEAAYFFLPKVREKKSIRTSGEPNARNLAVPFFDVTGVCGLDGVPGETIFVLPGPLFGSPFAFGRFTIDLSSQFQGADINGCYALKRCHLAWLWGVRWFQLAESLKFRVDTSILSDSSSSPDFFRSTDQFQTLNNFVAGQMGLKGQFHLGRWHLEGVLKGALGGCIEKEKIHGYSKTLIGNLWFITSDIGSETLSGGIFAQPSNSGTHRKTPFAYAVETRVNSVFDITKHWAIDIGYTFLWISKVLRPGKQIDRKINATRTALADASRETTGTGPGPIPFGTPSSAPAPEGKAAPSVLFEQSSFWATGLNIAVRWNF